MKNPDSMGRMPLRAVLALVLSLCLLPPPLTAAEDAKEVADAQGTAQPAPGGEALAAWNSPETRAVAVSSAILSRGQSDSEFRSQCVADTAACMQLMDLEPPPGYRFEYRSPDGTGGEVEYTRQDGSSRILTPQDPESRREKAEGMAGWETRNNCDFDALARLCFEMALPGTCAAGGQTCDCSKSDTLMQQYPCNSTYCREIPPLPCGGQF